VRGFSVKRFSARSAKQLPSASGGLLLARIRSMDQVVVESDEDHLARRGTDLLASLHEAQA